MHSFLVYTKGTKVYIIVGAIGGAVASALGGWDTALRTLMIFMIIDFASGWLLAAIFKKSPKTENGGLESKTGWKGLCRKGMTLGIVIVATQLDKMSGTHIVRDATVIGFCVNEGVSILENAGLMGIPLPKVLTNSISILKKKVDDLSD